MYLWQRLAGTSWWERNEADLEAEAGTQLAVIQRAERKRLIIQIACRSRAAAKDLQRRFGGRVVKLSRDWLRRFNRARGTKSLLIGKRLVITNAGRTCVSQLSRHQSRSRIVIPAGVAFGTGGHSTTAMSLRLLEQLTRKWRAGWSMTDLGTGSGILAVAAKRFGAGAVAAIDIDPVAISTARGNARLNHIRDVNFHLADVRTWQLPNDVKLVTANLFSELLIEVLPKLRRVPWVILSGVMRNQEADVRKTVSRNGMKVMTIRRRGKWVAVLAKAADYRRTPRRKRDLSSA